MKRSVRVRGREPDIGGDIVTEIPGEGFSILLRGHREAQGIGIAERLRRELAASRIDGFANSLRVTASFGIASRQLGESLAAWRARADAALAEAQSRGGDTIIEASVVEEAILLPPPAPQPDRNAA
jgi:GGDEF domain-containing protein